jgi:hypothetical protein
LVAETQLNSWRDTETRGAIINFVDQVTSEGSRDFVAAAERVSVFDNDGTLWSEKPIPIQLDFTLFRMAELAERDETLKQVQPYRPQSSAITAGWARPWSSVTTATKQTCIY